MGWIDSPQKERRPRRPLKARVRRFNAREYNYIQTNFKLTPAPILGQGEPPQGVLLYRRLIFEVFKGCHITLKSLILIIFSLPVNYLFVPLLDDIKKAYRTNLQTRKNHAHAKALKYKNVTSIIPVFHFYFLACAIIIITLCFFAKRRIKNIFLLVRMANV